MPAWAWSYMFLNGIVTLFKLPGFTLILSILFLLLNTCQIELYLVEV